MNAHEKHSIKQYLRAADYLTVGQIFLAENHLLKKELTFNDIKSGVIFNANIVMFPKAPPENRSNKSNNPYCPEKHLIKHASVYSRNRNI